MHEPMARRTRVALLLLPLAFPGVAAAQFSIGTPWTDSTAISVTTSAEVPVAVDRVVLHVSIAESDGVGAQAVERAIATRERVRAALQASGYPVERMQPWGLGYGEPAQMGPRVPGEGTGQRLALIGLRIPVEPAGRLDAVLRVLAENGIESVRYASFESTAEAEARERATREAVRRARREAEVLAEAAGVRLGNLRTLGTMPDFEMISAGARYINTGPYERAATLVPSDPVVRVTVIAGWEIVPR